MTKDAPKPSKPTPPATREERLKRALKANMAKRKAQARARDNDNRDGAQTPEQ